MTENELFESLLETYCDYADKSRDEVLSHIGDDAFVRGRGSKFHDWQYHALAALDYNLENEDWLSMSKVARLIVYIQSEKDFREFHCALDQSEAD